MAPPPPPPTRPAQGYDSDSSDSDVDIGDEAGHEDGDSFITTDVLLGYASKEPTEDEISQIGGVPSWISPDIPPDAHLTACRVCNERMPLLLQLHADLPDNFPGHDRRLHVFGCRRKVCRRKEGSMRVLRSIRVDPEETVAAAAAAAEANNTKKSEEKKSAPEQAAAVSPPASALGSNIFGGSKPDAAGSGAPRNPFALGGGGASASGAATANPFSLGSLGSLASKPAQTPQSLPPPPPAAATAAASTAASTNLPASFAEKAKIAVISSSTPSSTAPKRPFKPQPPPGKQQTAYPSYFLDADYEALGSGPPDPTEGQNARILEEDPSGGPDEATSTSGKGASIGAGDDGLFESTHDRTFQRFADRLWHNPEQVLRYEFGGLPLLYSRDDPVGQSLAAAQQGSENIDPKGKSSGGSGNKKKITTRKSGPQRTGIPNCGNCGATRVFECQLTPHAIAELEEGDIESAGGLEGMEWGTVIVGVCARDCEPRKEEEKKGAEQEEGRVGYLEEWAGVQWEEQRRK